MGAICSSLLIANTGAGATTVLRGAGQPERQGPAAADIVEIPAVEVEDEVFVSEGIPTSLAVRGLYELALLFPFNIPRASLVKNLCDWTKGLCSRHYCVHLDKFCC
jgi:hypothetical protein